MPVSGYRSDKKTRYLDATGFKKLLIKNNKDLEILLTNNRTFAGFNYFLLINKKYLFYTSTILKIIYR